MIVPLGFESVGEALRAGPRFSTTQEHPQERGMVTAVGDEGGFRAAPCLQRASHSRIMSAIEAAGYKPRREIALGMDCAASEFYKDGKYTWDKKAHSAAELCDVYADLIKKYPIVTIEDGYAEDDWEGWKLMTEKLGSKIQLVGDDLFVTNVKRLQQGIEKKIANSILIKVNQIGSLTETLDTIRLATTAGYTSVISHRSGETEDAFIADLAVATNAGQIKTGSLSRSDRIAKSTSCCASRTRLARTSLQRKTPFSRR